MKHSISTNANRRSTGSPKPIRQNLAGAPFKIGDHVQVVCIADTTASRKLIGKSGRVEYFEYSCGCGQTYPVDPMIGVCIECVTHEFWKEELVLIDRSSGTAVHDRHFVSVRRCHA